VTALTGVEQFDRRRHLVGDFSCGHVVLDRWLRANAGQSQSRDAARTFVVAQRDARVAGYYTIVAAQVLHKEATTPVSRGMTRHFPIPVALLARLAVDQRWQHAGLGRRLLLDALRRVVRASDDLAVRAITVDAIDESAASFYRHFGFETSPLSPDTLMIPLAIARRVLEPT
jgi:GNAT superfamily N-acetyltransferase